jgi:uncharacterized ion transporter superfamily protein YfcC
MYLYLVKKRTPLRVTLSLLLTLMAILTVVLVSWWFQELGLSFLTLLILGSLMPILWDWGSQKRLVQIRMIRTDSVQEWVQERRWEKLKALGQAQA